MKLLISFILFFTVACGTTDFMAPDVKVGKQPDAKSRNSGQSYLYAELTNGDYDEVRRGVFIYRHTSEKGNAGSASSPPQEVVFDLENPVYTESGIMYRSSTPVRISENQEVEVYTRMELVRKPDTELGETIGREIITNSPTVLCLKTCQ